MARKILHILGSLAIGGAENLVLNMLRHNAGKRAGERAEEQVPEYHVIYMQPCSPSRVEDFRSTGAQVTMCRCGKGIGRTFAFIRAVRGYIKRYGIDLIHCHNNIDAYWAYFASRSMKIPIVLTVHGFNLDLNFLARKLRGGLPVSPGKGIRYPDRRILREIYPVFVSRQTKSYYLKTYHSAAPAENEDRARTFLEKAPVIYNGIDSARLIGADPLERKQLLPSEAEGRRAEKNLRIFTMAGSFNSPARRRQLIICEAIGLLKERNGSLPFIFLFIGEPNSGYPENYNPGNDEYAACREFCREKGLENDIFFLPPRSDIPRVLQTADGYIYASERDTFGLSVIEAVIAGIPVICSNIPTFREVALGGELAMLAENTPEDFARAISRLLRELPENEESGSVSRISDEENATSRELKELRVKAVELYSIEVCIANYRALYDRIRFSGSPAI